MDVSLCLQDQQPHRCCGGMQDIVDHLESVRQALTAEQLKEAVQHDIAGTEELFKQVRSNPKIRITADDKYEYKVIRYHSMPLGPLSQFMTKSSLCILQHARCLVVHPNFQLQMPIICKCCLHTIVLQLRQLEHQPWYNAHDCALPCGLVGVILMMLTGQHCCLQPEHELQNIDELATLLLRHPQGMFSAQIKDSYKGALDDVQVTCFSLCNAVATPFELHHAIGTRMLICLFITRCHHLVACLIKGAACLARLLLFKDGLLSSLLYGLVLVTTSCKSARL